MKITNLTLKDFRCHEELHLELGRFNFIFGMNAAGKSSIEMAIEFLLCGKCSQTDSAGRGAEELVRRGAKSLDLVAEIDTGMAAPWTVERIKGPRGQDLQLQAAGLLPLAEAQALLCKRIGASPELIGAVLHCGRMWELPPAEQKRLLGKVLIADDIPVPVEIRHAMEAVKYPVTPAVRPDEVSGFYKMAYEDRTGVNRALRELANLEEPELPQGLPAESQVKQDLAAARSEVSKLVRDREQMAAKHTQGTQERARLTLALREREGQILPKADVERLEDLLENLPEIRKAGETFVTLRARLREKESLRDELQNLSKKMACPTCHRTITKKELEEILKPVLEDIASIGKTIPAAERKASNLAEAERADARLAADRKSAFEIGNLKSQIEKLPLLMEFPDTSAIDEKIADLNARIPYGEEVLTRVAGILNARRIWEQSVSRKKMLEAELSALELLIVFFGPDGAQKKATGDKLPGFVSAINGHLGRFGYRVKIEMEPFMILAGRDGGNLLLPLFMLSESERLRFSVAFQAALAMVTGLRMIVVDRADVLDAANRTALAAMLLSSELDQAIVLSTGVMPEAAPAGVTFIQLDSPAVASRTEAMAG